MELEGKRALVTGAGRGLGQAIAQPCSPSAVRASRWRTSRQRPRSRARRPSAATRSRLTCDVTDPGAVQQAIADTVERFGGLDVMVNNAGIEIGKPIPETPTRSSPRFTLSMSTACSTG